MSSADRRSGAFCAGTENAPLRVADSANARQREKRDEFAPYERASEPGKPEVYRAFAGARYALQRICEWLIVRMPDSVKKTERFHAALRRNAGHLRGKDNMSWEEEEVRSRNRSCFTWRSFYMREQTKIIL